MSFILGLLIGCILGAVGHYFWQHCQLNQEGGSPPYDKQHNIDSLFMQHPYIMNLIKSNLNDPEYKHLREFFVVEKEAIMNSSSPRMRYDFSDDMLLLLQSLKQFGYVEQLEHDSLLYRMDDVFVEHLRAYTPLSSH
jgi:hypothetical protein